MPWPALTSQRIAWLVALAGALCVAAWWVWPSWNGSDGKLDVIVISDPALAAGEVTIARNLRADGHTAEYGPVVADWCAAAPAVADAVAQRSPSTVVLSFAALGACGPDGVQQAVAAAGGRRVIVVLQAGDASDVAAAAGRVVDPARMVGADPVPTRMPCQWWEICDQTGHIDVRGPDGQLTGAGLDRLARMLAVAV